MFPFILLSSITLILNVQVALSTTCYNYSAPDTETAWQISSTTKTNLQNLRQSMCNQPWSNCGSIDTSGSGNANTNCWSQSSADQSMQTIIFGPNPLDNNTCWDNLQHIIDDCLTQDSTSSDGMTTYGLTGVYTSNPNVWIMTRVGYRQWGLPNPTSSSQPTVII